MNYLQSRCRTGTRINSDYEHIVFKTRWDRRISRYTYVVTQKVGSNVVVINWGDKHVLLSWHSGWILNRKNRWVDREKSDSIVLRLLPICLVRSTTLVGAKTRKVGICPADGQCTLVDSVLLIREVHGRIGCEDTICTVSLDCHCELYIGSNRKIW